MTRKEDGEKKPFYENIVSSRKRTQKPPKHGKDDGSSPSDGMSANKATGRYSHPAGSEKHAARKARSGSEARFSRERPAAGSSDSRDSAPRYPRREEGRDTGRDGASRYPRREENRDDSRAPSRDSRPDGRSESPRRDSRDGAPRYPRRDENRTSGRFDTRPAPRHDENRDQGEPRAFRTGTGDGTGYKGKPFAAPQAFTPVFGTLPAETRKLLEAFPEIVQAVFPLDSKKIQLIPEQIRELSHDLTDERGERRVGYMNDPAVLSAYIRYYQWWNLVRLSRLFVSLPLELADGDAAVDLGSGPLTLPIALWMARPDLRGKKITWYCVDISQGALAAGEELFLSLAARTGNEPWQIIRVKGECGVSLRRRVALVASANMFNELFQDNPQPIEAQAKHHAQELASYAEGKASVLVIEPGIPRAGRFVSLLRDALLRLDFSPVAPCPHEGVCPFPGLRYRKWCHFVFDTSDAPAKLHKISEDAGLAKDRAALSFIFSSRKATPAAAPSADPVPAAGENAVAQSSLPIAATEGSNAGADDAAPATLEPSALDENGLPLAAPVKRTFVPPAVQAAANTEAVEVASRLSGMFPGLRVRITSDPIKLPDFHTGRYGCSEIGMVLVTGTFKAADWLKTCNSGSLIAVPMPDRRRGERDPKTDAIIIRLK